MSTYKFTLRTNDWSQTFGADMVSNWEAVKIGLTRNENYRGLLKKFTGTFEFVGSVRSALIALFDKYGSEAEIYIKVEIGNLNKDRSSFFQLGSELKGDMTTFEIGELTANIQFSASGFEEKLFNRDSNDVEYATTTSIDGESIPAFTNETRKILLHDRILKIDSNFKLEDQTCTPLAALPDYTVMKSSLVFASDSDIKNTVGDVSHTQYEFLAEQCFLLNAQETKTIKIKFDFDYEFQPYGSIGDSNTRTVNVRILTLKPDLTPRSTVYDKQLGIIPSNYGKLTGNYSDEDEITVNEGDSCILLLFFPESGANRYNQIKLRFQTNNSIYTSFNSTFPATTSDCILPHELFSRICSVITGAQLPFYSEIFGRTDLGYAQDGEWAYLVALNGFMIRGFPFAGIDEDTTYANFACSLRDAFKAYNCILNLGATIEAMPDGSMRFRIDKYENLFGSKVILKLGDFISGATRAPNTALLFSELLAGYKDQEYEELNGVGTFNGQFNFSSPLKSVTKKMDIVCPWRADDYGIELARRKQYVDHPTEDTRYDDDVFLIDAKLVDGQLVAVKAEDFDSVNGILSADTVYNLQLSPGQNIRRWGNVIRAAMPNGGTLKFTSGPKNTNLSTTYGEITITENADIEVSELSPNFMSPEKLTIDEVPLTKDKWAIIEQNPNGLIEFQSKGVNLYGFLDDVDYDISKKTASITLIRSVR